MTAAAAAAAVLPAGFAAGMGGTAALVVGAVHSFPGHPEPGALVQPFAGARSVVEETGVLGVALYALVAVEWATEVHTVEVGGTEWVVFAKGRLGTPQGIAWYLHPAVHDPVVGLYRLDAAERFVASVSVAEVPGAAARAVRAWGLGGPPVHNFPM